jgi:putative transposase
METKAGGAIAEPFVMPKKKTIYSAEFPYHITARCINRDWFRLPIRVVWRIFEDFLYSSHHFYGLRTHAFVLMPNHFHLLASTPNANIDQCMMHFMTMSSREITRLSGRINQTYGGPYHASLITTDLYYSHCYKYIYRNPVEAGLAETVQTYPLSTLPGVIGAARLHIPVVDEFFWENPEANLRWMNLGYDSGDHQAIKRALSKAVFTLPKNRSLRKGHRLETQRS